MFVTCDDVLIWALAVTYEIGFVVVIMRLTKNTNTRVKTSFILIDCERDGQYRVKKKRFGKNKHGRGSSKCGFPKHA